MKETLSESTLHVASLLYTPGVGIIFGIL